MVLERLKKGLGSEPAVVSQLRAHQWSGEAQLKSLVERFAGTPGLSAEHVAWTASDPTRELRTAGLALLKAMPKDEALAALLPYLRTRSEAARRAVQHFLREVAGENLGAFLSQICETGDDFARLAALDLARELPAERAFPVFRRILQDPHPALRARALRAVSESDAPGTSALAANLALPMLHDDDEEIRLAALAVLERNPSEALISHVIVLARSGGTRVAESAFASLRRLMPVAQADHTPEILPLLADGSLPVRRGAMSLLAPLPPEDLARRFVEHFATTYAWVRDRAAETLREGVPGFLPAVVALSRGPDPSLAQAAAEMTLTVPDPACIPVWVALLRHPDWWIRTRALECLGKNGGGRDDVLSLLLGALSDAEMSISAAGALGDFGDLRAAGPLLEAFKAAAEHPDDQMELLEALAKVGEKAPEKVAGVLANVARHPNVDLHVREKARRLVGRLSGDAARDAIPFARTSPRSIAAGEGAGATLVDFLSDTVAVGASDFHIATGFIPHRRVDGTLQPLDVPGITAPRAEELIRELVAHQLLSESEWETLQRERQLDTCVKVPGLGRFRANFFAQREGWDASFRVIPPNIPTLEEIGLPPSTWEVCRFHQGLVLVTGPAGCGKTTTLAALVDRVNETRPGHIITIEDPVEFVHPNKEALVHQRQVPSHTASFAKALKAALREDPDVILVGEMRDLETISLAISAAETGHLVFGTLSTTTAAATVDRIINSFPAGQQNQIRSMVSESLRAVFSQALLPRRGGHGRVAAFEILRVTQAVAAMIRDGKTFQIPSVIQTGQQQGMCSMDAALLRLVEEGKVDVEAALDRAVKKEPFEKHLAEERLVLSE